MSRPCGCTTGVVCALHVTRVSISCGCTSVLRCALHAVPTFRACLHDVPEGERCVRCDDMALADVPTPKVPHACGCEHIGDNAYCEVHGILTAPTPVVPALSGRRVARPGQEHLSILSREDLDDIAQLSELRTIVARRPSALAHVHGLLRDARHEETDRRERGLLEIAEQHRDERDALHLLLTLAKPRVSHAPKVHTPEPTRECEPQPDRDTARAGSAPGSTR